MPRLSIPAPTNSQTLSSLALNFAFLGAMIAAFAGIALCQAAPKAAPAASSKAGKNASAESAQTYRNTPFGFQYEIPFGWVDRTKEMRDSTASEAQPAPATPETKSGADAASPDANRKAEPAEGKKSSEGEVLLAIFERPPDAAADTVNSAVVIAAESASGYPGLKKAEDYLDPLTELATAKGFRAEGDPGFITVDGQELVRADFTRPITDKLAMHQCTLILLAKGQIVSFTLIAGTVDDIEDLIDGLHFGTAKRGAKPNN